LLAYLERGLRALQLIAGAIHLIGARRCALERVLDALVGTVGEVELGLRERRSSVGCRDLGVARSHPQAAQIGLEAVAHRLGLGDLFLAVSAPQALKLGYAGRQFGRGLGAALRQV